jgi:excisionase family DNA binding protein
MPAETLLPGGTPSIAPLLMTAREAAKALAVCEKTLWSMTVPRGPLPSVRLGRSVRYAVADLHAFVYAQAERGQQ